MRYRGLFVAAVLGAAVIASAPAQADPVSPTPVVDMSTCTSGPVLCPIYGVLLGLGEFTVGNTMAMLTYAFCLGPVEPGHEVILPPIIYDFRPWCPAPAA